jgi:parallel beta-helix repeat protein
LSPDRHLGAFPTTPSNILIDSNLVIRQTDPKLAFPTYLQGIDAFDEEWTNVTVTNNVVVTSACWGIFFSSVHNGKIINNTVVADGLIPQPGNCKPNVVVGDKTHEGPSSSDNIIRNNIANSHSIYNLDPNMTMDHNFCLTIEGKCMILTYVNGKPKWGVFNPGEYPDHNIIDRRGAEGTFVGFDPAKFIYDLRLRSGAVEIGAAILRKRRRSTFRERRARFGSTPAPTSTGRTNRRRFSALAASSRLSARVRRTLRSLVIRPAVTRASRISVPKITDLSLTFTKTSSKCQRHRG